MKKSKFRPIHFIIQIWTDSHENEAKKKFFKKKIQNGSKHQNKAEFKNLDDFEVPSCDFPGLRTSAASTTSMASMTLTASFHQKIADPDSKIILGTKLTYDGPFL